MDIKISLEWYHVSVSVSILLYLFICYVIECCLHLKGSRWYLSAPDMARVTKTWISLNFSSTEMERLAHTWQVETNPWQHNFVIIKKKKKKNHQAQVYLLMYGISDFIFLVLFFFPLSFGLSLSFSLEVDMFRRRHEKNCLIFKYHSNMLSCIKGRQNFEERIKLICWLC